MTELKSRIHDESNGLDYVLVGDYYVPDLKLPEEHRPIGMWGRLHRTYLEQYRPTRFSALCLSGKLHTYLADLNEQAAERCSLIIEQMKQAEGVTETMKADNHIWSALKKSYVTRQLVPHLQWNSPVNCCFILRPQFGQICLLAPPYCITGVLQGFPQTSYRWPAASSAHLLLRLSLLLPLPLLRRQLFCFRL